MRGTILPLPHTSSWRVAYLSTGTDLPSLLCGEVFYRGLGTHELQSEPNESSAIVRRQVVR
jgi:hypothetical protein